jgi:pimeloyl-ACP methyl ester carboxylesterase
MADTILMIHGMWSSGWYWENYVGFFESQGYRCVTPTLLYHDISPGEDPDPRLGSTGILDYVKHLEREIGKPHTPILMGHSMGGLLAQILAARGLAKALVLLAPAPPRGIFPLTFSVLRCFIRPLFRYGFWRKHHRISFKKSVYAILHLLPPDDQKAIYEKMVFESGRAAAEIGLWWADRGKATQVDERMVTCPVMVIAGKKDRITPEKVVRKVAKKYDALDHYRVFENNAHWLIGEPGWEEIAKYISDWLKKNVQVSGL